MRLSLRKALLCAVVVASATTAVAVTGTPALAANSGCGANCDQENPNTFNITPPGGPSHWYHCSADAKTVDELGPADNSTLRYFGVTLQLRYSPACRTAWARAYGMQNTDTLMVKIYGGGGFQNNSYDVELGQNGDFQADAHTMWSRMMNDAGYTARACFTPRAHGSTPLQVCTQHPY
jgi:hypothetical protein